jgi:hypothetical protein
MACLFMAERPLCERLAGLESAAAWRRLPSASLFGKDVLRIAWPPVTTISIRHTGATCIPAFFTAHLPSRVAALRTFCAHAHGSTNHFCCILNNAVSRIRRCGAALVIYLPSPRCVPACDSHYGSETLRGAAASLYHQHLRTRGWRARVVTWAECLSMYARQHATAWHVPSL